MATLYKTIALRQGDSSPTDEGIASGNVKPGMLVELTSAAADTYQPHSTAKGPAVPRFALEDGWQGKTVNDAYTNGQRVFTCAFDCGDRVQALLKDGFNYPKATKLVSAGDGYLKPYVADDVTKTATTLVYTDNIVGMVLEARDLRTSGHADPNLCPIEVC